jgi:transcriptional regulator with XRE-family HTH domain
MKWEDIRREWFADPEFAAAFDRDYPYHELSLEIGGLRADLDMTQTEFGRLVGVPQSTVARLESGQQNPSVGTLKRIAAASNTELVIEFRHPKRKRHAAPRSTAASSPSEKSAGEPLVASAED